MGLEAACDKCNHVFKVNRLKTRLIRDDVKVYYFWKLFSISIDKSYIIRSSVTLS